MGQRRERATAEQWARRVAEWQSSGESATAFAGGRGGGVHTLRGWASRLGRGRGATATSAFVEVVAREPRRRAPLELVLRKGAVLRIEPGVDLDLVRAVVDALGASS